MPIKILLTKLCLLFALSMWAQTAALKTDMQKIISGKKAEVGVGIISIEHPDSLSINGDKHFPMQSVFKFHIALAILKEVDNGRLSLDKEILITKEDLLPNTWSPIREKYPGGGIYLKLSEILRYTVAESDNNGCDLLLRLLGGPLIVNDYLHSMGARDVSIRVTEAQMHSDWEAQFNNWTTPVAASQLLIDFYNGKLLSRTNTAFLWKIMSETSTGKMRIRGQLPPETAVAHKTGSSDTNKDGITAAINDIGIVTLPDGTHFAISVFVTDSRENTEANEKIIADLSRLAWNYFRNHSK